MTEPISSYFVRLVIALLVGGAIGLEREFKGKPAGMRTNMLICIGSCLIMIISIEIARSAPRVGDPGRIAAQVVTGIGFLGAGTIMRSRFHVVGLTTAATIWSLSALGLAIGAGYILLSVFVAFLITGTLIAIGYIEAKLATKRSHHLLQVTLERREGVLGEIAAVFKVLRVDREAVEVNRSGEEWKATFEYAATHERHHAIVDRLQATGGVRGVAEL
jgi:putative Mg2+ transporter-C (MgtC) family protein